MEFKSLEPVKITSESNFPGTKLGFYLGKCKKDGGYKVYLSDREFPLSEVCVLPERGDTIVSITKPK